MPTYTVSLISAKSDKFDTLENIIVSGKSVRHVLDDLQVKFDTTIRAKGDHYKLARSNSILYIERYSPDQPTLADFQNLPEPAAPYNAQEYKTAQAGFWCATVFEAHPAGYSPTQSTQVRAITELGAYRAFMRATKTKWKRCLHYWIDDEYRLLTIGKSLTQPNLPLIAYSVELFQAPHPVATYSLKAHNPWHAALYLGETLGIEFENRRYLDVTDRFDAEDAYCLVHTRKFPCQFSI